MKYNDMILQSFTPLSSVGSHSSATERSLFLANVLFSVSLNTPSRIGDRGNNWVSSSLLCQCRCYAAVHLPWWWWWWPVFNNEPVLCAIMLIGERK